MVVWKSALVGVQNDAVISPGAQRYSTTNAKRKAIPMATIVKLTNGPVRVTAAGKQDLRLAVDLQAFDEVDFAFTVYEGSSVAGKIITSMNADDDVEGWVDAGAFAATSATGTDKENFKNLLRYVRWEITSSGNATFSITGMARRWG